MFAISSAQDVGWASPTHFLMYLRKFFHCVWEIFSCSQASVKSNRHSRIFVRFKDYLWNLADSAEHSFILKIITVCENLRTVSAEATRSAFSGFGVCFVCWAARISWIFRQNLAAAIRSPSGKPSWRAKKKSSSVRGFYEILVTRVENFLKNL